MIWFYLGAIALLEIGLVFALWPMIRSSFFAGAGTDSTAAGDRQQANVALYQDHLRELENSLEQGLIAQGEFDQLKRELESNLLADSADNQSSHRLNNTPSNKRYWALVMVSLPLVAFAMYLSLGNINGWQLKQSLDQKVELERQLVNSDNRADIENQLAALNRQLAVELERHVAKFPEDLQTKALLARNAVNNADYDRAIAVYQQIIEQEPQAAQMMVELAQTIFIKANNRAVPVVGMLAARAVAIQPNNAMALGLLGMSTFQNGQYQQAIDHWQQALPLYPPNSPNARALENGIAQARARLAEASPVADNPKQQTANNDNPNEQSPGVAKINVAVSLADHIPVEPDYAVFIYARAWQGAKLPLAITRINAAALPLTLELNDTMAMAPGMNLSSAEQVELVARVSPSGNAIAQPGDWQATLGPVSTRSQASETVFPLIISQSIEQ